MKNEGPFILEWVAYHLAIGFDKIVVCSNDSDDGTAELLDSLANEGYVTHIPHTVPIGESAQASAARVFNNLNILMDDDWVIWLDADEFLNVHVGDRTVDALIERVGGAHGILIPWRIFGDAGNLKFGGRYISHNFERAALKRFQKNREVKTLFKYGPDIGGLAKVGIHRPILKKDGRLRVTDFLNGKGKSIDSNDQKNTKWLSGESNANNCKIGRYDFGWRFAQINHYCVRTPEYFALKRSRGRGYLSNNAGQVNQRHTENFYRNFNRNEDEDRTILHWSKTVDDKIAELLQSVQISESHAACVRLSSDALESISEWVEIIEDASISMPVVTLPDAEKKFLADRYAEAETILEYGSGGSTVLASRMNSKKVFSVESDLNWAKSLRSALSIRFPECKSTHVHHVDIGATKAWGYPIDDSQWKNYHNYALDIWDQSFFEHPDLILIDGRFRLGCFAAALLKVEKPTTVLFDDYFDRPEYHAAEKYCAVSEKAGRMAEFNVKPATWSNDQLTELISWFNIVR